MGRHARARKRTNIPLWSMGPVDTPDEVDEEPTRVDAERPLNRLETLLRRQCAGGAKRFPSREAEGAPAWSEAPWLMRDSRGW